ISIVWMPPRTRGNLKTPLSYPPPYVSSLSVDPSSSRLYMIWIYAMPNPAKMIKNFTIRDRSHKSLVHQPMRQDSFATIPDYAIPVFVPIRSPLPTKPCREDLLKEALPLQIG